MSPSKPAGVLKVQVPRHNAQRLGPAVTEQVRVIAREQGLVVQLAPPVQEQPGNASSSSAENASEWNSLLASARAQRGPQWDVGTQQFQVAKGSELYYNPTPLLAATRSDVDGGQPRSAHGQSTGGAAMSPHATRSGGMPQAYGQIPGQGHGPPYGYGANVMQHGPNAGTPYPASAVPAGHFYGNDAGNSSRGSSTMPDGMATPDSRPRRVTRAMTDEFPGHFNH